MKYIILILLLAGCATPKSKLDELGVAIDGLIATYTGIIADYKEVLADYKEILEYKDRDIEYKQKVIDELGAMMCSLMQQMKIDSIVVDNVMPEGKMLSYTTSEDARILLNLEDYDLMPITFDVGETETN